MQPQNGTHLADRRAQRVSLQYLLRLVPVDHRVQAREGTPPCGRRGNHSEVFSYTQPLL